LRFGGGLHVIQGRIVVEAELDTSVAAGRLRQTVLELFGGRSEVILVQGGALRRSTRYHVRFAHDGERLARQTGLLDQLGRPVLGLPPSIVSGGECCAGAAWRGAFLARGSLAEPGRAGPLDIIAPGPEAGLALVGAARRLGVAAKSRDLRGVERTVVRDGEAVELILIRMGAPRAAATWAEGRLRRQGTGTGQRLANFDDANMRRSVRAAVAAAARVERAFEILGDDIPDHLRQAAELRLAHREASLEELGLLANPPLTKDAVAGRIRRLLSMADKRAAALDLDLTEAAVPIDLYDI
jgi:DNA-binding protein WhiA